MEILSFIENLAATNPSKVDEKIYAKNEIIYEAGEVADKFYCIKEGKVKVTVQPKTKEITKEILVNGEIFGELNFGVDMTKEKAKAMTKTKVYVLQSDDLNAIFMKDKESMLYFFNLINEKRLKLDNKLISLVQKSSKCRIVDYLLELKENRGERMGYDFIVRDFITHAEIAQITSTSRQTVTTVLNDLRDRDIVDFDRKRLVIKDLEQLKIESVEQ